MSIFEMTNIKLPNHDVKELRLTKTTTPQLSSLLRGLKALKSYWKARLKELGKISLGNISSYYECLKTIQSLNEEMVNIKNELNKRHIETVCLKEE